MSLKARLGTWELNRLSPRHTFERIHFDFLRRSTVRFFRFWTGTGSKDGSVFFAIHAVLTTSLGLAGIWRLFERRRVSLAALFLLPLLLFPLPYYITHAEFRYRLVIDPVLMILAGYAVSGRDGVQPC